MGQLSLTQKSVLQFTWYLKKVYITNTTRLGYSEKQQHETCQTRVTKAGCTLTLCRKDGRVWESNVRNWLALKSDTQRGQEQDMEKWYRKRNKEIEENFKKQKQNPPKVGFLLLRFEGKDLFLFYVVFAFFYTPTITHAVQSAQIYRQKLRRCKGQEDRDCWLWCSTCNSVFLVCDKHLEKKRKK